MIGLLSDLSNLAVHRRNIYSCKRIITFFCFMLFSMCDVAVNFCDKLPFSVYCTY